MYIESLEWRNLNSYGNKWHKLDFNKTGDFYLVVGNNGSGKSSLSEIIQFGIYGKVHGKNITDIANRFNNATEVKIQARKNKTKIEIHRGISPSFVNLKIGGIPYDKAGKRNIETYIEDDIMQMPFYVFNNIITLSINDFKSFLSMKTNDKRLIIDKIFGLNIINDIKELIKNDLKEFKNQLILNEREIDILNEQIDSIEYDLKTQKDEIEKNNKFKETELIKKIEETNLKLKELLEKKKEVAEKNKKASDKLKTLQKKRKGAEFEIRTAKKHITLFENDKCPTCTQSLKGDDMQQWLNEEIEKLKSNEDFIVSVDKLIEQVANSHKKIKAVLLKIDKNKQIYSNNIAILKDRQKKLKSNGSKETKIDFLLKTKEKTDVKIDAKKKESGEIKNKQGFFDILERMFSEKGLKQLALERILPTLNTELFNILKEMGLNYRVEFDNNFNPIIRHLGHEVSASQLSTGEKKKIDFAILITLIKMVKIKNPGLNLFFLDEIFSSLDNNSIHHVLQVLANLSKKISLNIFVINHTILPSELFTKKIDVVKVNNFSQMTVSDVI